MEYGPLPPQLLTQTTTCSLKGRGIVQKHWGLDELKGWQGQ